VLVPERGRTRPVAKDGSALGAVRQVLFHGRRRVSQSPRRRTLNRWGGTGKPAAPAARLRPCRRATARLQPRREASRRRPEGPFDLSDEFGKSQLAGSRAGNKHNIGARPGGEPVGVENRPKPPPHPIADDRAANLAANGQADAGLLTALGNQARQMFCSPAPALPRNSGEIRPPAERSIASQARKSRAGGRQTVRRLRPFLRRAAITRRPFLVAIRERKPWTRLRRRLWGWNVRFT
jgi:hypothetical protein